MAPPGATEPTDAELVRRSIAGDRDAFETIYRRYHAVVFRFARSMSGSAVLAEDVTQEVFVTLIRDLSRYQPHRARLATYLYGVARHVTRGRLRKEQRFVRLHASPAESRAAPDGDPAVALIASQELSRLRAAIVGLPSRYREVVVLCDLHDVPYADAAAIVGAPVGTVRSRLHRARGLLAAALGRAAPERPRAACGPVARCLA